tara:strand:+ start:170 stop:1345 length:1176 start_codon:yes stop_codon:yes gene_type:complete
MSNIYTSIHSYIKNPLTLILYVTTFIIAAYNLRIGTILSPESYLHSSTAEALVSLKFNYFRFFEAFSLEQLPNILPISLIAFLKIIFPNTWMEYFVYINIACVFFSIYLFQRVMLHLKIDNVVISICCFLFLFSSDFLTWPRYILYDTIYVGFSFLLIHLTLSIKNFDLKKIFIWLLCLLFVALTNKLATPVITMSILFLFIYKMKLNGKVILIISLLSLLTSALLYSILTSVLINHSNLSEWSLQTINFEKLGIVIHSRPDTYINMSDDIFGFFKLFCYRFLYFFNPYASSFSIIHIIFNSVITMVYFLGLIISTWNWTLITFEQKQYFLKINLFILFIAIFHSATLIDADWRYRFPVIILMIIIGAISFQSLIYVSKEGNIKISKNKVI